MARLGTSPTRARAFAAVLLVLALAGAGCGQHSSSSARVERPPGRHSSADQPTKADFVQIRALLARRAAALEHHSQAQFLATVDHRNQSLVHRQRTLYQNLVRLGTTSLSYDVDTSTMLVPARVPGGDPVLHPDVTEQVQLVPTTTRPVSNPVDDTFVQRDGRWLVGAEGTSNDESSFEAPQERPWAGAPIAVRRSGPLTVVMDSSDAGRLASLTSAIRGDIAHDASLLGVAPRYAVLIDASTNGNTHAMNSLTHEDAAAVTKGLFHYPHGDSGQARLAGTVIKVNPQTVTRVLAEPDILRHELTHYLLRAYSGSSPRWLVEGVAAWVQYYPDDFSAWQVTPGVYSKLMHADRQLPTEGLFYDYPDVNYPIAQAAVTWLVSHYGTARLLALMKAYRGRYQGVDIDPLTPKVLRQVYGVTPAQVVAGAFGLLASLHH